MLLPNSKSDIMIVVGGNIYNTGLFLDDFMKTFGTERSATSMIGSLKCGVLFLAGPIAANLVNHVGWRVIRVGLPPGQRGGNGQGGMREALRMQ